jgi:hypothetical protein
MNLMARWGVAVAVSAAAFALSWWLCQGPVGLDEGTATVVAGAVLAVVLAVAAWWAARERPDDGRSHPDQEPVVIQETHAGGNAYTAGRNQTVINMHPDKRP